MIKCVYNLVVFKIYAMIRGIDNVKSKYRSLIQDIGKILIEMGCLNAEGCVRAVKAHRQLDEPFGEVLLGLGLISDVNYAEALARLLKIPVAEEEDYPAYILFSDKIPYNFLRTSRIMILSDRQDFVEIALADPSDEFTVKAMELALERPVRCKVGLPRDIEQALERASENAPDAYAGILKDMTADLENMAGDDIKRLKDIASEAPVIRLVNRIISMALNDRASDIHIEPYENKLVVRYRVDGVLREVPAPPAALIPAIISRIKIMANLNIAERRLPQDGRISIQLQGKLVDLRVSILPSLYGESAVIRILETTAIELDFSSLGMAPEVCEAFINVISRRHGMLLVTGPTGSGKTTSLYAALKQLNEPERKIITVEDPIEYQLDGITQIQVNAAIDMSFANVLRSIVRQDPDVIMIGEMRDLETAEIAVQSALTGHVVLSTLHTNDAAGAITRLLDMGIEDYLMTSTVNGILAQRLVRTLCPACRQSYVPSTELVKRLGLEERVREAGGIKLYKSVGCKSCGGQGYIGRMGIYELLVFDDHIRELVLKRVSTNKILDAACKAGMKTMVEDAIDKALAGLTTIEEIQRITREH